MGNDDSTEDYTDDFVPTYLNFEPVVILSLTETELITTFLLSLFISLPIGIILGLLISNFMAGMVAFVTLFLGFLFLGGFIFRVFKRNKPRGYFGTLFRIFFRLPSPFYLRDVHLIVGRSTKKVVRYE